MSFKHFLILCIIWSVYFSVTGDVAPDPGAIDSTGSALNSAADPSLQNPDLEVSAQDSSKSAEKPSPEETSERNRKRITTFFAVVVISLILGRYF